MENTQKLLDEEEVSATSGGGAAEVTVNGKKEVLNIKIAKKEVVDPDDVEMLQDLIISAVNEANRKKHKKTRQRNRKNNRWNKHSGSVIWKAIQSLLMRLFIVCQNFLPGRKSATKMALKILEMDDDFVIDLQTAFWIWKNVHRCKVCGNLTESDICLICSDGKKQIIS